MENPSFKINSLFLDGEIMLLYVITNVWYKISNIVCTATIPNNGVLKVTL